jgi:hypothetical protein
MRCKFSVLGGKWLTQNSEEKLKVLWEVTVNRIVKIIANFVDMIIVFFRPFIHYPNLKCNFI